MAIEGSRAADYELRRTFVVFFGPNGEFRDMSKHARSALQMIVILRAGAEVSQAGVMHDKFNMFCDKVEAHKAPLIAQLQELASITGIPLPDYVSLAINNCNNKGKKWTVARGPAAWRKYTGCVATMRNLVAPLFEKITKGGLPSGKAFDESVIKLVQALAMSKKKTTGNNNSLKNTPPV